MKLKVQRIVPTNQVSENDSWKLLWVKFISIALSPFAQGEHEPKFLWLIATQKLQQLQEMCWFCLKRWKLCSTLTLAIVFPSHKMYCNTSTVSSGFCYSQLLQHFFWGTTTAAMKEEHKHNDFINPEWFICWQVYQSTMNKKKKVSHYEKLNWNTHSGTVLKNEWGVSHLKKPSKKGCYINKIKHFITFHWVHIVLQLAVIPREIEMNWVTERESGGGQYNTPQPWTGIKDRHTQIFPSEIWASTVRSGCVHVFPGSSCVIMLWVSMSQQQISFELLIWNKVAQEAGRAVILFPNVRGYL